MGVVLPFRRLRWSPVERASRRSVRRSGLRCFSPFRRYVGFIALAAVMAGAATLLPVQWQIAAPARAMLAVTAIDGDTLRAGHERIRLYGIDAPELAQTCRDSAGRDWACGRAAKARLASLVANSAVTCASRGRDRYGRMLGICSAGNVSDVAELLVQEGYAVDYSRYSWRYSAAARTARAAGRGIWRGSFENPEQWRHRGGQ